MIRRAYGIPLPPVLKRDSGKPYFPDRPDIHFSLSHTKTHVLCAVSTSPVGVDIETIRSVTPGVPARVCSADELKDFTFFELWVLKESFIKLSGSVGVPLKNICFKRFGSTIVTPEENATARVFNTIPCCYAAVVSGGEPIPDTIDVLRLL